MRSANYSIVVLSILLVSGFLSRPNCHETNDPQKMNPAEISLKELSWIAGHWEGTAWGGIIEEIWSPPIGNSMTGMFRFIKDDTVQMYEILTIEQPGNNLELKLRHFNPGLIAWEEKDNPNTFHLFNHTTNSVDFQMQNAGETTHLIFRKTTPDSLKIFLDKEKNGKKSRQEFRYSRRLMEN